MITIIGEALPALSATFVYFYDKYEKYIAKNKRERQELSEWLIKIGDLIKRLADSLDQDIYPHALCGEMDSYIDSLPKMLRSYVDEKDIDDLYIWLDKCRNIEKTFYEMKQLSDNMKKMEIGTLYFIAGVFIGRGETLKLR